MRWGKQLATGVALLVLGSGLLWIAPAFAAPGPVANDMSDGTPTATTLAETLVGSGVTVSNATYSGADTAAGTFSAGGSSVGFDAGVVLSSGAVTPGIEGPNDVENTSTNQGTPGDTQLSALAGQGSNPPQASVDTFDASILEFDFVPQGSSIVFSYVFASEEYREFVYEGVNDVFGFFVNGGNCALVPGTTQPVSVDTINNGNPDSPEPAQNPQFYRDNPVDTDPIDIEFDGLTTVLTCSANVSAGQTNRIRLAIADAGDAVYDSAVFLQQGSFTTAPTTTTTTTTTTVGTGGGEVLTGDPAPGTPVTPLSGGDPPATVGVVTAAPATTAARPVAVGTLPETGTSPRRPTALGMALIAVGLLLVAGAIVARHRSMIVERGS
jgi:hypothetical protein